MVDIIRQLKLKFLPTFIKTLKLANSSNIKRFTNEPKKDIMAFPVDWIDSFGTNYL